MFFILVLQAAQRNKTMTMSLALVVLVLQVACFETMMISVVVSKHATQKEPR
jgi:hypothetical protein